MDITQDKITVTCVSMAHLLVTKNQRYGNSALEPLRVFSNADPAAGILVRLDDKLSRIKNASSKGESLRKNDIADLIGYLVLYCVKQGWTDFDDLID